MPTSAASPSDLSAGMAASQNGPSAVRKRLMIRRRRRAGRRGPASSASDKRAETRPSSAAARAGTREQLEVALEVDAPLGGRLGHLARVCTTKPATRAALAAPAAPARCRESRRAGEHLVLAGEDLQDLVDLACSAGFARRMTSWRSSPRPASAGAELVEDDRQPLAVRQAHDVVDQVDVDRRWRCARPAAGAGPRPGRPRSRCSVGGAARWPARLRRLALDEASRRSATAGGSCTRRPRGSPGSPRS